MRQGTTKPRRTAATTGVEAHQDKLPDVLGAVTVELLRLDARRTPAPSQGSQHGAYRRRVRLVLVVLVAHLAATLAGLDLLNEVELYAALVGIGVLPSPLPRGPSRSTETGAL